MQETMKEKVEELGQLWRDGQMRQVSHAALRAGLALLGTEEPVVAEALADFWKGFAAGGRARPQEASAKAQPFGADIDRADWWALCCLYVAADPQRVVGMRVHVRDVIFDPLEARFPYVGDPEGDSDGPVLTPKAV